MDEWNASCVSRHRLALRSRGTAELAWMVSSIALALQPLTSYGRPHKMLTTTPASFDAIQWIGKRQPSLQRYFDQGSHSLLHFALMWNMFEGELCDSSANSTKLREVSATLAQRGLMTHPTSQGFLKFVQERYWDGKELTGRFQFLHLRSVAEVATVSEMLSGQTTDPPSVAHALLLIVCRYRNNTFHGLKEITEVLGSPELFDQSAKFLSAALECA